MVSLHPHIVKCEAPCVAAPDLRAALRRLKYVPSLCAARGTHVP